MSAVPLSYSHARCRPTVSRCSHLTRAVAIAAALPLLSGCYTQIATIDRTPPTEAAEPDSSGRRVDTVRVKEREVCYWTRDLWGRPVLQCDNTYYSRDWYLYNYAPWWYRYDNYWYDYDRCPRYYYYDQSCGCCRYYLDRPCYDCGPGYTGGGGSSGGAPPAVHPPRPRTRSVPPSSVNPPAYGGGGGVPKEHATDRPPPQADKPPSPPPRPRGRGASVESSDTPPVRPAPAKTIDQPSETEPVTVEPPPPPQTQFPRGDSASAPHPRRPRGF